MHNKTFPQFLDLQKHRTSVIGFTVAIIHLVTIYILAPSTSYLGRSYYMATFLTTPSLILGMILPFIKTSDNSFKRMLVTFLLIGFSSFFYGITASFLVSRNRITQWIGILLLCLLILTGCFFTMWAAQMLA